MLFLLTKERTRLSLKKLSQKFLKYSSNIKNYVKFVLIWFYIRLFPLLLFNPTIRLPKLDIKYKVKNFPLYKVLFISRYKQPYCTSSWSVSISLIANTF